MTLLALCCCTLLTSCETGSGNPLWHYPEKTVYTDWRAIPGGAPASYRVVKHNYDQNWDSGDKPWDEVYHEIRNDGSKKLYITGLSSRHENARFVDLEQPGSFDLAIYPGQTARVNPDGNNNGSAGTSLWVSAKSWREE